MVSKTLFAFIIFVSLMIGIYASVLSSANRGWGYIGYKGYYHRGPSFWYFGNTSFYPNQTFRSGSTGSKPRRGGGPHAGK